MPQSNWSQRRERQYDHIKESLVDRDELENEAEEIAARTVNKERARSGEARTASRTSKKTIVKGKVSGAMEEPVITFGPPVRAETPSSRACLLVGRDFSA